MPFAPAIIGRKPTLLLFVTLETLLTGFVWSQYRHSNLTARKLRDLKSHIPHAKSYGAS